MDDKIKIARNVYEDIVSHARKDFPIEACGYLFANEFGDVVENRRMTNADASGEHFSFVPEEQFDVLDYANQKGFSIVGVYHSHPETPARPSKEDIRLAYDESMVYVIISLANGQETVKAFEIKSEENVVREITIVEV